ELDLGFGIFKIEARVDLFQRLLNGVADLLQIDFADDVEGIFGHKTVVYGKRGKLTTEGIEGFDDLRGLFSRFMNSKEAVETVGRSTTEVFCTDGPKLRNEGRGVSYVRGFIELAAMWDGRQIRRVRFDEHSVQRAEQGGVANVLCLRERHV